MESQSNRATSSIGSPIGPHRTDAEEALAFACSKAIVPVTNDPPAAQILDERKEQNQHFYKAGAGSAGVIIAARDHSRVHKFQRGGDLDLDNDYVKHRLILKEMARFPSIDLRFPTCAEQKVEELSAEFSRVTLWKAATPFVNLPTKYFSTGRILPLRKAVRDGLIELYCPPAVEQTAHRDPGNLDCLVRPYLGRNGEPPKKFSSLRNYKLGLNQLVHLGLDVRGIAHTMGQALAVMHWAAKTDARDIEFVLGSSLVDESGELSDAGSHIRTDLFLLDFNLVRDITLDDRGVEDAVQAFKENDPYYPRPFAQSEAGAQAWRSFAQGYSSLSAEILGTDAREQSLGDRFLASSK